VLPFVPLTLQTAGVVELNTTGLPDAPPAALAVVVPKTVTVFGVKVNKVIVWLASGTANVAVTVQSPVTGPVV
jgi:hypothetical protein